ncbi:MAG TPA: DUF6600 domain-containing protein [Dissulfurispiraceae bacterium]|nr:DUF6600 domain-containing protein [Dissulfurispiraceae bacterium]
MKVIKAIILVLAVFVSPAWAGAADLLYARISLMTGDVQVRPQGAGEWGLASMNDPLGEGDELWVPEGGRVEIQLANGVYIRLDRESALQVLSLNNDTAQFYLSRGRAYVYYSAPDSSVMQFDTPDASTRVFDSAVFRVDILDQYTDVGVYKGYVETENSIGSTTVNAGEMISLGQDTNGEAGQMGPPDEWEKWNKMRNDQIFGGRHASLQYLPDELRTYSSDFDDNGQWVDIPDYGYCWVPTVILFEDWAPYRYGRWMWRGDNYIWVGRERWGWAPYHYGRWAFVGRYGWCWVPPTRGDVYWGPGYVGWVRTADYVAWVPLAPRETYYGRGYYGRHSVNITGANIARISVTNVYRNVDVDNSVTIVNSSSFNTALPRREHVSEHDIRQRIFVRSNMSVIGPDIKPSRSSYFGSDRQVPRAQMPPNQVREQSVRELRESRPFVKERNRSVMRRGAAPEKLPVMKESAPGTPGKERPALQRFRPAERSAPEVAPAQKAERREVQPQAERKGRQMQEPIPQEPQYRKGVEPPVRRTVPDVREAPAPRSERREIQPPAGPVRPAIPENRSEPKIERREMQQAPERERPEMREVVPERQGGERLLEQGGGPQEEQRMPRFDERRR